MGFSLTTLIFELVNFLVLLFLLHRLVFRPIRRAVAERRAAMAAQQTEVTERLKQAETLRAEYEQRAKDLETLRAEVLRQAGEDAARERARFLEEAREEAAAEGVRSQRVIETEREAALGWAREVAVKSGMELAGRLLYVLAPQAADEALLSLLCEELSRQAPGLRSAAKEGGPLLAEVVWARPAAQAQEDRLRAAMRSVLGSEPALSQREDPSLLAGAVLRVGHRVFDASVAGQLAFLAERARALLPELEVAGG